MLPEEIRKSLFEIADCIAAIEEYLARFLGERRDFDVYKRERFLRRCIEREVEIIGEATNRILQADPTFVLENARKIIATRNYVAHSYDSVNDGIIWGIVVNHLPPLRAEVERLLSE